MDLSKAPRWATHLVRRGAHYWWVNLNTLQWSIYNSEEMHEDLLHVDSDLFHKKFYKWTEINFQLEND